MATFLVSSKSEAKFFIKKILVIWAIPSLPSYATDYISHILGGMRTNNSLEGIHNRINKFDTNNPTIWNFIDKLRSFDESIYSDVLQWNNGLEPSARKKGSIVEKAKVAVLGHYD